MEGAIGNLEVIGGFQSGVVGTWVIYQVFESKPQHLNCHIGIEFFHLKLTGWVRCPQEHVEIVPAVNSHLVSGTKNIDKLQVCGCQKYGKNGVGLFGPVYY